MTIEGSEKRKRQFTFELQNSRDFEKRSKIEQKEGVGRKKYACPKLPVAIRDFKIQRCDGNENFA